MKQYTRWIVLAVVALPVGAFLVWPMFNPEPLPINEPNTTVAGSEAITSAVAVEAQTSQPAIAPPVMIKHPLTPINLVIEKHLGTLVEKSIENDAQLLMTDLAGSKAQEREANQRSPAPKPGNWQDELGIGRTSMVGASNEAKQVDDVLSRIQLAGLITVAGHTSASLALDGFPAMRVSAGSEFAGVKVRSVTSKGVTLVQGEKTRYLSGASYE